MSLSLPTLETGSRPFYYLWDYLRKEKKLVFRAVSNRGKLDHYVAQPISLTNS